MISSTVTIFKGLSSMPRADLAILDRSCIDLARGRLLPAPCCSIISLQCSLLVISIAYCLVPGTGDGMICALLVIVLRVAEGLL
jgi:hypothetical protein